MVAPPSTRRLHLGPVEVPHRHRVSTTATTAAAPLFPGPGLLPEIGCPVGDMLAMVDVILDDCSEGDGDGVARRQRLLSNQRQLERSRDSSRS